MYQIVLTRLECFLPLSSVDYAHRKAALVLFAGYQTPGALRTTGAARLEKWLRDRRPYNAGDLAARAIEVGKQRTTVIGHHVAVHCGGTPSTH